MKIGDHQAFPASLSINGQWAGGTVPEGMTYRQWLIGMALTSTSGTFTKADFIAFQVIERADAVLASLEKEKS